MNQYNNSIVNSWDNYIGNHKNRIANYIPELNKILKKHKVKSVLDLACGTAIDSIALLELGYQVSSIDFSEEMINKANNEREKRANEPGFSKWSIDQMNWLDIKKDSFNKEYDAAICIGNSFSHLLDNDNQNLHKKALENFNKILKKGGILIIDHRNFDYILKEKKAPINNIYYNGQIENIKIEFINEKNIKFLYEMKNNNKFELKYYPHKLNDFAKLLTTVFDLNKLDDYEILEDFKIPKNNNKPAPGFYQHIITKK